MLILILTTPFARAQTEAIAALAHDPTWIKLGHYDPDNSSPTGWRSAIHPGEFFLHANGDYQPLEELKATIAAFDAPLPSNLNRHAQCHYPARLAWLKSKLGENAKFRTDVTCPEFDSWTHAGGIESISVVFVTGYLGNPATYYGHTLLKFNARESGVHTSLLDVSVNYGAILEGKNDNPAVYIFKSLTGGYDAGFSHIHYYYHEHNYGNHELRDMWEYKLSLAKPEIDQIVAHAWEVLGKRYTYFFFQGNCAYQMGKVLEIVDGVHINPDNRPWTIPQALIQRMAKEQYQGRPLIAKTIYHPSRQSRFYEKYLSLSDDDATMFRNLAVGPVNLSSEIFKQRPLTSKQAILDTLVDYQQFAFNPLEDASSEAKQIYANALAMRFQLPAGTPPTKSLQPSSPEFGRPSGWMQVGLGHNGSLGNTLSLEIRPAYYDPLDADSGHVRYGALAMGDLRINLTPGGLHIDRFDITHIESVNPAITQLENDRGGAWKLRIGAEQARLGCGECLVARVQGDMGYGHQFVPGTFAAAYIGGSLQTERAHQGIGFVRGTLELNLSPLPTVRTLLGYEYRQPLASHQDNYGVIYATARLALSPLMDLRLHYANDRTHFATIGLGAYW